MRMKTKTSRAMALLPKLAFMALHKRCSVEKKNQEKGKKMIWLKSAEMT